MDYKVIIFEKNNNFAKIILNRPDKLNALNFDVFDELNSAISDIEQDNKIKALIITGSGEKAFAAGADIKELNASDGNTGSSFSQYGSKVFERLENLKIPVIAAVNGFALGGGCELALACHMRFASEKAKFGQPEVNLGIIPGYGGTQRLTALVGKPKSIELITTGNMISADEAKSLGLINDVYPAEELISKVEDMVKLILSKSSVAVSGAIDTIQKSEQMSIRDGLNYESEKFGQVCGTEDFKEGTSAFLEKRKPEFKGK